jgi:ABC-type antimicrobial peptide transport system permease subunit
MGDKILEVVGVMKDAKYGGLDDAPEPYFCLPLTQDKFEKRFNLVVRTAGDPRSMMGPVLEEIRRMAPTLPVSNIMTLNQILDYSLAGAKGTAMLVGIFGLLALTLAMAGVYGVMSFAVYQRTQEFGIRMALGAGPGEVLKMVLGQGMLLTLIGISIGLALGFGVTRFLSGFLYEVSALDPFVFSFVSLALGAIAALACYVPARWATEVDPMTSLRYE